MPTLHSGPSWTTAQADPVPWNTRHDLDLLVVRGPPGWGPRHCRWRLPPLLRGTDALTQGSSPALRGSGVQGKGPVGKPHRSALLLPLTVVLQLPTQQPQKPSPALPTTQCPTSGPRYLLSLQPEISPSGLYWPSGLRPICLFRTALPDHQAKATPQFLLLSLMPSPSWSGSCLRARAQLTHIISQCPAWTLHTRGAPDTAGQQMP